MPEIQPVIARILEARAAISARRSVLVAVSGIDASGKGFVTARLVEALRAKTLNAAGIHVDGWLNLPDRRFSRANAPEHYYRNAMRFDDLFADVVLPLREHRSVRVVVDHADETDTAYRKVTHAYDDVDVIVVEGIFLLKAAFRAYYDLSVWIECGFETALQRAVKRGQEGLPPQETIHAYRTIYFPAQRIHFAHDDPRRAATLIVDNDRHERKS